MKLWLLAFVCIVCFLWKPLVLHAQETGAIKGMVVDSSTQAPLEYVTILVLNAEDSILSGAISDTTGQFHLKGIPKGSYRLRLKFIGYPTTDFGPYKINPPGTPKPLRLALLESQIGPVVEITDKANYVANKIDRKVYAVDRNMVTQGGSAAELLNTIPSVEVDMDGQLSLRGNANVTVFIDGKPSTLTGTSRSAILDQLPASMIKSVEVITNPSAKYDPDGTAGIINIVTKKESRQGLNGNISVGIGTNNKFNTAASLNLRRKKFNAYANYSFRYEDRWNEGEVAMFTPTDTLSPWLFTESGGERSSVEQLLKAGVDFNLGPKSSLGVAGTVTANRRTGVEENVFLESNADLQAMERYIRNTEETEPSRNVGGELYFQRQFAKPGRQLDARVAVSQNTEQDEEVYKTDSLDAFGQSTGAASPTLSGSSPQTFVLGTAQLDYVHPIGEKVRMEAGLKSSLRDLQAAYLYGVLPDPIGSGSGAALIVDSSISNSFRYQEQVHAAYLILGRSMGKFSAEAGLRAEQALTGFTLLNNDSTYTNNYFNVFPSAHLSWQPVQAHELRAAYSRRINRPETDNLNPFTEYANPKRLRRGNPLLQPEYIQSLELSDAWRFKAGSLSSTVYYRRFKNTVTRVIEQLGGDTLQFTFANMLNGHAVGLELIGQLRPAKWLDLTLSSNLFRTSMDASNLEAGLQLVNYGVDGRFMGTASLGKRWSLQSSYNYQPPRQGPQGRIGARHSMDAAVKHTFMKGKANLNLRVSDVFNTMAFRIHAEDDGLVSDQYRKRETRIGFLTFSYRFGQEEKGQRKQRKEDREGGGGGGFDF